MPLHSRLENLSVGDTFISLYFGGGGGIVKLSQAIGALMKCPSCVKYPFYICKSSSYILLALPVPFNAPCTPRVARWENVITSQLNWQILHIHVFPKHINVACR